MSALWTPPDGEYAKKKALEEKQAACSHHFHFCVHAETKMTPAFEVECCRCDLVTVILQPDARGCMHAGPVIVGELRKPR